MRYAVHPLAALIPEMAAEQYTELRDDIQQHGLIDAIVLHENMVLHGRHRLRACEETGVEPRFENFTGPSPVEFVVSVNVKRRHLTPSQLAAIAVDFLPAMEEEAKRRQGAAFRDGPRDAGGRTVSASTDTDTAEAHAGDKPTRAADQAGALVGVSAASVNRAKRVQREDPEMFDQVKAGEITARAADTAIRERTTSTPIKGETANKPKTEKNTKRSRDLAGRMHRGVGGLVGFCNGVKELDLAAAYEQAGHDKAQEWIAALRDSRITITRTIKALEDISNATQ
jgi:ParB-like chromosome segregation protein Spo0J